MDVQEIVSPLDHRGGDQDSHHAFLEAVSEPLEVWRELGYLSVLVLACGITFDRVRSPPIADGLGWHNDGSLVSASHQIMTTTNDGINPQSPDNNYLSSV